MILLFKYNDKILKFFPRDANMDLIEYVNSNLPKDTAYKIVQTTEGLSEDDLNNLLASPDGFSTNNLF